MRGRQPFSTATSEPQKDYDKTAIIAVQNWFKQHVSLQGQPYTLDFDQARAVHDLHQNTLVTARAGSGKTRVIVAKVAYLVAHQLANFEQIQIFMFNRTAAAEVNQRIAAAEVDGRPLSTLSTTPIEIASTFHKFALDIVKTEYPKIKIISEVDQSHLIFKLLQNELTAQRLKLPPTALQQVYGLVGNFLTRAGQKYPGPHGLATLKQDVATYCKRHQNNPDFQQYLFYHQIATKIYAKYCEQLQIPQIDFNQLMAKATELLKHAATSETRWPLFQKLHRLKFIMIDEYQDFSYLFFALIQSLRALAPNAKLFAVGDDWQAINRFAGSDVNYFIHFDQFFPDDYINIPLATNYRSARRIVEQANHYMLTHYDPNALPAKAFSRQTGRITIVNPRRTHFDASDIEEDSLGDGRFLAALEKQLTSQPKDLTKVARYLKTLFQICKRHPYQSIMLLHRHNFTSFDGIKLETLHRALGQLLADENVVSSASFEQQVRTMTMHKSKGLEADVVILLEFEPEIVSHHHPHATIFEIFGDTLVAEKSDQQRLIYVALTRAKQQLYLISSQKKPLA